MIIYALYVLSTRACRPRQNCKTLRILLLLFAPFQTANQQKKIEMIDIEDYDWIWNIIFKLSAEKSLRAALRSDKCSAAFGHIQ